MNTRPLRALAFAMLAGASLSQAGIIDYRGSEVPRDNRGEAFRMDFLVFEYDSTRTRSNTDPGVYERIVVNPDFSGQYSTTIGNTVQIPNVLKPGNGLYLMILIPGGDTIPDRRLRLVERTEDCQSIWSLDGMKAPARSATQGSVSAISSVSMTVDVKQTMAAPNDPSLGLESISALGGLVGVSPTQAVAAIQPIDLQPAAHQADAQQIHTTGTCPDAMSADGRTRIGTEEAGTMEAVAVPGAELIVAP